MAQKQRLNQGSDQINFGYRICWWACFILTVVLTTVTSIARFFTLRSAPNKRTSILKEAKRTADAFAPIAIMH